ncbi:MAG TPA: TlpA disulfide reductase family protein [bacterium]
MTRRALVAAAAGTAALAILAAAGARPDSAQAARGEGLQVGQAPPAFSATDLNGLTQSLGEHDGEILVLHFWATWCGICRGEIPKLITLHEEFGSKGVTVLAVSVDEDLWTLRRYIERRKLPYVIVPDSSQRSSIAKQYGIYGVPTTYIISRDGKILARIIGPSDLVGRVRRILSEAS